MTQTVDRSTAGKGGGARAGLLAPLRSRDFRLLATGQSLSSVGDTFFIITVPFLVLSGTGSASRLGLVLGVMGVARLATAAGAGALVDRVGPRLLMLVADAGRAVAVTALAVAAFVAEIGLVPLLTVAVVLGALEGLYLPAYRAMTPAVLPDGQLAQGNSVGETLNLLAWIIGGAAAAAIAPAVHPGTVLLVDAATFVASAVTLVLIRRGRGAPTVEHEDDQPDRPDAAAPAWTGPAPTTLPDLVRRSPVFRTLLLLVGAASLTAGGLITVAMPVLAHARFADGQRAYGVLMAAEGAGMLLGGVAALVIGRLARRGPLVAALVVGQGATAVLVPALDGLPAVAGAVVVFGACNGVLGVLLITVLQLLPPRPLLGRAMSLVSVVSAGLYPLSSLVMGAAAETYGPAAPFAVGGAGLVLVGLAALTRPGIRRL